MRGLLRYILSIGFLIVIGACGKGIPENGVGQQWMERTMDLRVMSFNVRSAASDDEGEYHWDRRKYPCVRMLKDIQPDIIGFQETIETQIAYFESALSGYAMYRIPQGLKQFANVIFYNPKKFELIEGGYRWFSLDTPTEPSPTYPDICNDGSYRTFMWVKLRVVKTDKVVWLFDTHLPWNPDKSNPNDAARRRCIEAIVKQAKRLCAADETVFVVGDLNAAFATEAGTYSLAPLKEWMTSAYEGVGPDNRDSYRSSNSFSDQAPIINAKGSIDHIFYRNVEPVRYKTVVSPNYGVRLISDHYPIYFDCRVSYKVPVNPDFSVNFEGYQPILDFEWREM